jgi:hypothetical protein
VVELPDTNGGDSHESHVGSEAEAINPVRYTDSLTPLYAEVSSAIQQLYFIQQSLVNYFQLSSFSTSECLDQLNKFVHLMISTANDSGLRHELTCDSKTYAIFAEEVCREDSFVIWLHLYNSVEKSDSSTTELEPLLQLGRIYRRSCIQILRGIVLLKFWEDRIGEVGGFSITSEWIERLIDVVDLLSKIGCLWRQPVFQTESNDLMNDLVGHLLSHRLGPDYQSRFVSWRRLFLIGLEALVITRTKSARCRDDH